jgi:cyclase
MKEHLTMLRPRIIPCLLVHQGGLVKTAGFKKPKYVGDPINAVKIFNEKEADELVVLDIDATVQQAEPNYKLITFLAAECRMPLCYGGGVRTAEQIKKIVGLGVEKVAVSAAAVEHPEVVGQAAEYVGNQSVVVVLDVKKRFLGGRYDVLTRNGNRKTGRQPVELAVEMEQRGAGEIVVNSIDHDGLMQGYDLDLIRQVRDAVKVPVTALGGAGSLDDIGEVIRTCGVSGAAAGSLFVFKGKYKAVLINYPAQAEKEEVVGGKGNAEI